MKKEVQTIQILFPVKKHIYKYLKVSVGNSLIATKNSFFGALFLEIIKKKGQNKVKVLDDAFFPVKISVKYMYKYGIDFDEDTKKKFNSFIESLFRKEMITYVNLCRTNRKSTFENALREFLCFYEITEDDIKFETLIRYIQRKTN